MKNSPLRYPGGKTRGLKQVYEFFPANFSKCVLVEVFGGSWVVPFNVQGLKRAIVNDYYTDLQNFWWVVRGWPLDSSIGDEIEENDIDKANLKENYPLYNMFKVEHNSMVYNVKYLERLKERWEEEDEPNMKIVLGAAFFYLRNRIKYSGIQTGGDSGGFHCLPGGNVLHQDLNQWHDWYMGKDVRIWNKDFREVLDKVNAMQPKTLDLFVYLDPPYVQQGSALYKHGFNEKDHRDLAEKVLSLNHPWALSYDDDPLVWELYDKPGITIEYVQWEYSSTNGNATTGRKELIITNQEVDPVEV